jgi:small neutral amino acid transporter SnatA (MarC family)
MIDPTGNISAFLALAKESSLRLLTRIMGLILTALAVEFVIQGLKTAFPRLHQ